MKKLLEEVLAILEHEAPDPDQIEAVKNQVRGAIAGLAYSSRKSQSIPPDSDSCPVDPIFDLILQSGKDGIDRSSLITKVKFMGSLERDQSLRALLINGKIRHELLPTGYRRKSVYMAGSISTSTMADEVFDFCQTNDWLSGWHSSTDWWRHARPVLGSKPQSWDLAAKKLVEAAILVAKTGRQGMLYAYTGCLNRSDKTPQTTPQRKTPPVKNGVFQVEPTGIEPATPSLQS